jgi:hypothetical protein
MADRGLHGDNIFNPRAMVVDLATAGHTPAVGGHLGGHTPNTTILGENMRDRVIPFAERTDARIVEMRTPADWASMTPQERYHANDGALRARINEGDSFRYIGQDPTRPEGLREQFDLTRSEIIRLEERGVPYEVVSHTEVVSVIGRP